MARLTEPYGQLMSGVTTNVASTDTVHVPNANNLVIEAVETAGGTVTLTVGQKLPGATTFAPVATMTITANESEIAVIPAPIGEINVTTSAIAAATLDVFYGCHFGS